MKLAWISAGVFGIAFIVSGYQFIQIKQENNKLQLVNSIYEAENRILKDEIQTRIYEIRELEIKPSYNDGYKDALIRIGGPNNPGAYQDGWDAAMKVAGEGGYANGYHAAIQQFSYQKPDTSRYLISTSEINKEIRLPLTQEKQTTEKLKNPKQ